MPVHCNVASPYVLRLLHFRLTPAAAGMDRALSTIRPARTFEVVATMPERSTLRRARRDKQAGKAPSTQAGEFVREAMHHIREGEHGARSPQQAIAIGLSEARRAGVELPSPAARKASPKVRRAAQRDLARGHGAPPRRASTPRRARASLHALRREGQQAASPAALAEHAHEAASRRSPRQRSASARQASRTKGPARRAAAARKAGRSRAAGSRKSR